MVIELRVRLWVPETPHTSCDSEDVGRAPQRWF
jgi:hypothetical protein